MTSRTEEISKIDACLPQTQCTLCGYPRCLDYASAIFDEDAPVNRCSPGGEVTINALASLQNTQPLPLAPDCEVHQRRLTAVIREDECIGCALCLDPCPVDAIIGAPKHLHIVATLLCSGCRLCVDYCPVDCIEMVEYQSKNTGTIWPEYPKDEVDRWRTLATRHFDRLEVRPTQNLEETESTGLLRIEIREAVNRGRERRWRKHRKKLATRVE